MKKGLSLIIPCYNEEGHLHDSYERLTRQLSKLTVPYEMIVIDDKSTDNTVQEILLLAKKDKKIGYLLHKKNVGRGGTVAEGIKNAQYAYVGFVDIDLEIAETYIPLFIEQLQKGADVVIAKRTYPFSFFSFIRIFMSKAYMLLRNTLLPLPISDTEAGYKFFNREKILPIIAMVKDKKWFWDTEIIVRVYFNNLSIVEIPTIFLRRKDKASTVKLIPDSIEYLRRLFVMRKELYKGYSVFLRLLSLYKDSVIGMIYVIGKWLLFPFNEIERYFPKQGTIIDIGCGEGVMTFLLSLTSPYRKVIGLDASKERIDIAQKGKKLKNVTFIHSDAITYTYPIVNGVIMSDFLHHLDKRVQEILLQNVATALTTNGIIVIKDVDKDGGLRKILSRVWDFLLYPKDQIHYRSAAEWKKMLIKYKMDVEIKETAFFSPFSTVLIIGRKK